MEVEKRELPASLPMQTRQAPIMPASVNAEARTVDVVFTTGAAVRRRRWTGWDTSVPFDETLVVSRTAIDFTRLNAGAPALDSHSTWSSYSQVGVVERAWIEDDKGMATIRFPAPGTDEAADRMFGLVSQGIIRNISVGYSIDKARVIEAEKKGDVEQRLVERWTPHEISFVTIPADAGAQVRSAEPGETYPVEIIDARSFDHTAAAEPKEPEMADKTPAAEEVRGSVTEENNVTTKTEVRVLDAETAERSAREAAEAAVRAERDRSSEIRKVADKFGVRAFGDEHIAAGTDLIKFRELLIDHLAEKSDRAAPDSKTGGDIRVGTEHAEKRAQVIEAVLMHRIDPAKNPMPEGAREFRGLPMIEMARDVLEANGVQTRGMSRMEIASEALAQRVGGLHSTADFPIILGNTVNRTLRAAYEAYPQTFRPLVRQTTVSDFKAVTRAQLGEAPRLEKVNEHGEFKRGTIGEAGESYKIATFGKIVGITRQALINDDLGAFSRLAQMFGAQAAQLESDLVWAQIAGNPKMGDNVDLFHATHKNLAAAAAALDEAPLSLLRTGMAKQKGLDGKTVLNIRPSFLLVPADLETKAEKLLRSVIYPQAPSGTIPDSLRQLAIISEPRLGEGFVDPVTNANVAGSATAYYLAASPGIIDTVELAYLDGQEGVYTESRLGFTIDGVEIKVRLDAGAKVIDWRAFAKNAGA